MTTESSIWCYWDVPLEFEGEIACARAVAEARNVERCTAAARHVERLVLIDFVSFLYDWKAIQCLAVGGKKKKKS